MHLAGQYDNPIPTRFLAPIDCLKIPALLAVIPDGVETGFAQIFHHVVSPGTGKVFFTR